MYLSGGGREPPFVPLSGLPGIITHLILWPFWLGPIAPLELSISRGGTGCVQSALKACGRHCQVAASQLGAAAATLNTFDPIWIRSNIISDELLQNFRRL